MKKIVCALAAVASLGILASCGNSIDTDIGTPGEPDGKWELVEAESEGEILDAKKENWFEQFDISGTEGKYTIKYKELDNTYDVTLEKQGDEYDVKMRGIVSMGKAKFGTKKMVYEMGEGKDKSTLVYKKI